MKNLLFLLSLLFVAMQSCPQDYHVIDSLKMLLLNGGAQDTNTVRLYLQLGNKYTWNKPDSAIYYHNQALLLSKRLHFTDGEFQALTLKPFPLAIARSDSDAVSCAYRAVKIAEDENNSDYLSSAYFTLGSVYMYIQEFNKGIMYHRKALSYMSSKDSELIADCNEHFAQCFLGLHQTDSAFYYAKKVYGYNQQHKRQIGFDIYQMGSAYFQKGNLDSALKYYKEALQVGVSSEKNAFKKDIADCNIGIANVFQKKNAPDSAIFYAKNALDIANGTGLSNEKIEALNLLTILFDSQSKIDSAYIYQKYASALKDTVYNSDRIRQVQLLSFNEDMNRQQLVEQQEKRINTIIIFSLIGALLSSLAIAVIIFKNGKQRKKAYALLQKQKHEIDLQKTKVEQTLTDLKATQDQLIQSEKMASLGELTAGIAHEIQNPLNFVNNFSEVNGELVDELRAQLATGNLQLATEIADDLKDNEAKILHHGKRADAIVKGMLQHTRTSTGQKEPTDINALCDEYLRLSYHGMRAKDKHFNAQLETNFDGSIGEIKVVPQDMGRVLLNLYNNAFYALSQKLAARGPELDANSAPYVPTVTLVTKKLDEKIEISVKDNGAGIPSNIVDKIFQPFFTTKPTGEGTGLGLSLSYDIIKAHAGEISARSGGKVQTKESAGLTAGLSDEATAKFEAAGQAGSEFIILLPV